MDRATPPRLVPGLSARRWTYLHLIATLSIYGSLVTWLWLSIHAELLLVTVAAVAFFAFTIIGYRRAAFRERAAGYTTTFGAYAGFALLGRGATPVVRLFPTADLWQLNPKNGEVVRPPGEPTSPDRTGLGIL
jgi:hypothetical protein